MCGHVGSGCGPCAGIESNGGGAENDFHFFFSIPFKGENITKVILQKSGTAA